MLTVHKKEKWLDFLKKRILSFWLDLLCMAIFQKLFGRSPGPEEPFSAVILQPGVIHGLSI